MILRNFGHAMNEEFLECHKIQYAQVHKDIKKIDFLGDFLQFEDMQILN